MAEAASSEGCLKAGMLTHLRCDPVPLDALVAAVLVDLLNQIMPIGSMLGNYKFISARCVVETPNVNRHRTALERDRFPAA
ncbi:MAG: hypothetical protein GY844_30965 [Bradyrhizobium sp.]|nr:hypothetical protein [Bradyrhizobium sp.]